MGTNVELRKDANKIINSAIKAVLPDQAVKSALENFNIKSGNLIVIAIGKAAWQMAKAASDILGDRINKGLVITKYKHVKGEIQRIQCIEAGHPIPDENSYIGTKKAIEMVKNLNSDDKVIFLISGGGSSLFEMPLIAATELQSITKKLLACGADIAEINTIRKRLSGVKGGKFAQICFPAKVYSIVLSDVLGDSLDVIASGPAYPDASTCEQARMIIDKYNLKVSSEIMALLGKETPKILNNVETHITGSVKQLCKAAEEECRNLHYKPVFLTASLTCEAKEAGKFLGSIAMDNQCVNHSTAYICGGETVVKLTGNGKGGRNQELALSAAIHISGLNNTAIFSVGSDGTDGPTDAAGGYVDNTTAIKLKELGIEIEKVLNDNDSYHALKTCNGLIFTGPTGTNVNDLSILLIKR